MKVAIIGASGLVGKKIISQISRAKDIEIIGYASKQHKGEMVMGVKLQTLSLFSVQKCDYAIFSAGSEVSKKYAPRFAKKGAIVIDNTSAFRRKEDVALVVPEINFDSIKPCDKIIANPNCSTIQIALVLHYINKLYKIKRVVISTYQSASGAGTKGLEDLDNKTAKKFKHILYDNLLPQIDEPLKNGYTMEEDKIIFELKKILSLPNLAVTATAVRVPIHFCHGASVNVEFEEKISLENIKNALSNAKGICLKDDLEKAIYPLPSEATNKDEVFVGRIRRDFSVQSGINFWVVSDNLRKGAATNAVQIMNLLRGKAK